MLRSLYLASVIFGLVAFQSHVLIAKETGHSHGNGFGHSSRSLGFANSWPCRRAEDGQFRYGGWGYGAAGWGLGYGWPDAGYFYPESLPYFNLYPPVYYGYSAGTIVPNAALQSSWPGISPDTANAVAPPPVAPASRPLTIPNPYYTAEK